MRIGITGHQNFENQLWVASRLDEQLDKLQPSHGYSSLAIGADQLFVRLLAKHAIPYTAIIPSEHYDETFTTDDDRTAYEALLKCASETITLDNDEPSEQAFYDAGIQVVDNSDVILAVWNGKPAQGLGGTADMVKYAKVSSKAVIHVNPITKEINFYDKQE